MGGKTSGAALQGLTDLLFRDVKQSICSNYLDDVVSGSKTFEGMVQNLALIFGRLRKGKLKIKARKCRVFRDSVFYLGCTLNKDGLSANMEKVKALIDMQPPSNKKGVQRFMGLANYFREFVPGFAEKAKGMTNLLQGMEFTFGEEALKSFQEIKKALITPPCLAWADPKKEFHLFTDSSDLCLGFCLMQKDDEGKLHPIFYGSKCLTSSQLLWPSFCKEFYAAYVAIKRLRFYLLGTKFTLYTDCQGMTFEKSFNKCTSNAVLRWCIELSEYEFQVRFIPGTRNLVADQLSRGLPAAQGSTMPSHSRELYDYFKKTIKQYYEQRTPVVGNEEEQQVNLGEVINRIEKELSDPVKSAEVWDEEFLNKAKEDKVLNQVKIWVKEANKVEDPMKLGPALRRYHNKLSRLSINEQGLLCLTYYNKKAKKARKLICVPEDLKEKVMQVHHDLGGGHLAGEKTMNRILQKFYFPNIKEEVTLFCKTCSKCLKINVYYGKRESVPLKPIIYKYPGLCVSMDVVMVVRGGQASKVLTVVDKFTKWVGFFVIRDEKAKTIARTFLDKWVCYWSVPEILITDNAASFKASEVMNNLYSLLGLEKKFSTPFHPEGNGQVERENKVLLHMLQKLCDDFPKWKSMLGILQMAVNSAVNRSTGYSAFKLMTGREMRGLENICFDVRNNEYYENEDHLVNATYKEMKKVFEIAGENLDLTHELQKKMYDKNRSHVDLHVKDRVLLYRPKDTSNKYHKLKSHWQGPHLILKVFSGSERVFRK
jgi:hypothetical protein